MGAWPGRRSWSSACQTARDRVVTCLGPVNTQPKGLLSHAYEIGGSTEVLAPVTLGHIGQAEACVGLHTLTDPGLRGQETRLRRALGSPAGQSGHVGAGPGADPATRLALKVWRGWARLCQEGCLEEATEAPPRGGPRCDRVRLLHTHPLQPRLRPWQTLLRGPPGLVLCLPTPGVPAGPGSQYVFP